MELKRKQKHILLKFFSMFSVVRGYNILIMVAAQYLASIYIFSNHKSLTEVLFDLNLLVLVLASSLAIAGGYIINNFYDSEKDLINRPNKSQLDRLVSQNTKLSFYFVLNFLSVILASYISFTAVLFYSAFIFGLWFYSHKLKRRPIIGNLFSASLSVMPFFAVFIYYNNYHTSILLHASFLLLLIFIRELTKDLENIKGDIALNYKTVPIVYGVIVTKRIISGLVALTIFPIILLTSYHLVGYMSWYFFFSLLGLLLYLIFLWKWASKTQYVMLHNWLKFILVLGVFSIALIDVSLAIK